MALQRCREYLKFDATWLHRPTGFALGIAAWVLFKIGHAQRAVAILCSAHRAALSSFSTNLAERTIQSASRAAAEGKGHAVLRVLDDFVANAPINPSMERIVKEPHRILESLAIVIKSSSYNEKGVLFVTYSDAFLLFARCFDLHRIAERYHIVIEPDWSGYCNLPILSYMRHRFPVFVLAYEPRDAEFIRNANSNLISVPLSTNWWVDYRQFPMDTPVEKDADVVMIAAWANYKRHYRLFHALSVLRRRGIRLKTLLAGYCNGLTLADIRAQAAYYGVDDQIEFHDAVPYEHVNGLLRRAKVNVIWSRKEGVNRAIIEGMFSDVPCLVRDGFNYGYRYPYVNEVTGHFATERALPDALANMVQNHQRFSPRQWVMDNMTCQHATRILDDAIRKVAVDRGETWTGGLAVKVNKLNCMEYWDPADRNRFDSDYAFLRHATLERSRDDIQQSNIPLPSTATHP